MRIQNFILALILSLAALCTWPTASYAGPAYPPTYWTQTTLPRTGTATYYAPGVMELVLRNRIAWGQVTICPDCVGYVALLRAGDIGRKVWLAYRGDVVGPVLVIDTATPWDFLRIRDWWAVDVSWEIAQRWHMRGGLTVTVYPYDPRTPWEIP
jgi:hypothetical protein